MTLIVADAFWSIRTVNDVVGIVGLLLALASIWVTWWLARRDIQRRLREATEQSRQAVARIGEALLRSEMTEAIAVLKEALAAAIDHSWHRTFIRLNDGRTLVSKFLGSRRVTDPQRRELQKIMDDLRQASNFVGTLTRPKSRKQNPTDAEHSELRRVLTTLIESVVAIESRLRLRPLEEFDEQSPD